MDLGELVLVMVCGVTYKVVVRDEHATVKISGG